MSASNQAEGRLPVLVLVAAAFVIISASVLYASLRPSRAERVHALIEEAEFLRDREQLEAALGKLEDASAIGRANVEVALRRAEWMASTDPAQARALVDEIPLEGLSEPARLRAVRILLILDEPQRAREMLGESPREVPLDASRAFAQAQVQLLADRDAFAARQSLEAALRVDPDHVQAKQLLARLLFQFGDVVEQSRAKSLARELDAANELPLELLGRMLFAEDSPLFREEIIRFGERLLEHPDFEHSPFFGNLEFARVMSRRFKLAGRLDLALEMEDARRRHPDAEENDLFSYFDVALRAARFDLVEAGLPTLTASAPDDIRPHLLRAGLSHLQGDLSAVTESLDAALASAPPSRVYADAVHYLSALAPLGEALERELARRILEAPEMPVRDTLAAATTLIHAGGEAEKKSVIVSAMIARFGDYYPEELADWLRRQGEVEMAYAHARAGYEDGHDRELLPLLVDLATTSGDFEAAESYLAAYETADRPLHRDLLDIRIELARGDRESAGRVWDRAWERATGEQRVPAMSLLCQLAVGMRDFERAHASYEPLVTNGIRVGKETFYFIAHSELQQARLEAARAVFDQASVFYPDAPEFVNDRTYLSLLLRDSDRRMLEAMEKLVEAHPGNTYFQFTLALSYLVHDFRQEALETIRRIDFQPDSLPESSRAIYAAVLSANDLRGPARQILAHVNRDALLADERTLLEPFIGNL